MTNFYQYNHTYDSSFHYHCLKNCLLQLLEYYQVPNAYLYINVASEFSLIIPEKFDKCIVFNDKACLETTSLMESYITRQKFKDFATAELYLHDKLKLNYPVIVVVDTYYLPYHLSYKKYHGAHSIIICGEDDTSYKIVDWYEPHFYKGVLAKEDLRLAGASNNKSNENPFSKTEANYSFCMLAENCKEIINRLPNDMVFYQMLENVYEKFYVLSRSYVNNDKFYGITALKKWVEYLSYLFMNTEVDNLFYQELHNNIFLLYISKRLLNYYVNTYLTNVSIMHEKFLTIMKALLLKYENVLFVIMKSMRRAGEDSTKKIISLINEIIKLEIELGVEIKKIIKRR